MLKKDFRITHFVLILTMLNFVLFHYPFFRFVFKNLEYNTLNGVALIFSLIILMLLANAFFFYLIFSLSLAIARWISTAFFIISSLCVYFINTYSVIIDESMMGNVFNTNSDESGSFFSIQLIFYIFFMGILPSYFILKSKIIKDSLKKTVKTIFLSLTFMLFMAFANATNWLWIDKNSKTLGGLAMPWSYTVNTALFFIHKSQQNQKEILLPNATIKDNEKSVVVLVIGESARKENFSLYGYKKNTNPLLSKTKNISFFNANSCATYTTAGVKCILEHKNSDDLYEILPNYLYRNNVDVIWRTTNWGEPPVHIKDYQNRDSLKKLCKSNCDYDEVLLSGLKEQIINSKKNKILVVLHTSISHGPAYSKKYPAKFEVFKPICNSVELGNCTRDELVNAYDNTIVYTDFILHSVIENLIELPGYKSTMIFVSDHGESLGENNLYMHGLPKSIAPKEQYEIPFIVWTSENSKNMKPNKMITQNHVFHSVVNFLAVQSPIYDENMNIYK